MTKRCGVYVRISSDPEGEALGVERQEQDCRVRAEREGWSVEAVYADNDRGASNLSRKPRPGYAALLEAVRASEVDVILAYSNSRLTRRPMELEDLIRLHEQTGVLIKTIVSGDDDLSTADGRMVARIKASVDAAEAERTGERVKRAAQQRAERGLPRAGRYRTFGYTKAWEVVEEEAEEVRNAFRRIIVGESLQSIAKDWQDRGVSMGNGKAVRFSTVKNVIQRALYAGLSTHHGEVVGKSTVPAIVDEATFEAAQLALGEASRTGGYRARHYLLSGIPVCGKCLRPMYGTPGNKRKDGTSDFRYICKSVNLGCGGVSITGWKLDAIVLGHVRQNLITRQRETVRIDTTDYAAILQALEAERAEVLEARNTGGLALKDAMALLRGIDALYKETIRASAESEATSAQHNAFASWEEFVDAPLGQKKALISTIIETIEIKPSASKQWNPDRIEIHYHSGAVRKPALKPEKYEALAKSLYAGPVSQSRDL